MRRVIVTAALVSMAAAAGAQRADRGARPGGIESPQTIVPAPTPDPAPPADLPQAAGPRGTSDGQRYDAVGYAAVGRVPSETAAYPQATITMAHPSLPVGAYAEVTRLDSGATIVALVAANAPAEDGRIALLSPGAAQALHVEGDERVGVRVRVVTPIIQDQMALRSGQMASPRIDAPPVLLTALRKRLPGQVAASVSPPAPSPPAAIPPAPVASPKAVADAQRAHKAPPVEKAPAIEKPAVEKKAPPRAPVATGSFVVQVAAFSTAERAASAARAAGGHVMPAGKLFRLQLGPFPDAAAAKRARDAAAAHGYRDARVAHSE